MIKIKRSDVEVFFKLIEAIYGKENISKEDNINFIVYKDGYLLQYINVYYQLKSFQEKWNNFNNEFVEKPIEHGFSLPYHILKRITRMHRNERDEYIKFNVNQDKTCCKRMAVLETILNRFQIDLNNNEFNELKKSFKMEWETKDLYSVQKNNKIIFEIKAINKVDTMYKAINKVYTRYYDVYFYDLEVLKRFINYFKPKTIELYFNNDDVFIKIDKALLHIKQFNEED